MDPDKEKIHSFLNGEYYSLTRGLLMGDRFLSEQIFEPGTDGIEIENIVDPKVLEELIVRMVLWKR